jgi:hypothetical protein
MGFIIFQYSSGVDRTYGRFHLAVPRFLFEHPQAPKTFGWKYVVHG